MKPIIFLMFLLTGCVKPMDPIPDPCPDPSCDTIPSPDTTKLKLLWKTPILEGNYSPAANLYFHKNDLLITYQRVEDPAIIRRFDIESKEFLWEVRPFPEEYFTSEAVTGKVVVLNNWSRTATLDPISGSYLWSDDVYPNLNGWPRTKLVHDQLFHTHNDIIGNTNETHLVRRHALYGQQWDTIYSLYKEDVDGFATGIEMPTLWMHPESNDSILVFQHRMHKFGFNQSRVDVVAWNLNKNSLQWKLDHVADKSNVKPILIFGNLAFLLSGKKVLCFDLMSGKIKWDQEYESFVLNLTNGNYAILDQILIVKSDDGAVFGIDPETGVQFWKSDTVFSGVSASNDFVEYKEWIIEASGDKLDVIRKIDGVVVYTIRKTALRFNGQMAIDLENHLLYIPERFNILCYQLPETF